MVGKLFAVVSGDRMGSFPHRLQELDHGIRVGLSRLAIDFSQRANRYFLSARETIAWR